MQLPEEFLSRFSKAVSDSPDIKACFLSAMEDDSPSCVRLNPLKKAQHEFMEDAAPIEWCEWGYRLPKRPLYDTTYSYIPIYLLLRLFYG